MADEQDRTFEFRYYDYSPAGAPVGPDDVPGDCPACRGTGRVLLLVSTRPCEACGGTGKIGGVAGSASAALAEASGEPENAALTQTERWVPGHWVTTCDFDVLGRLRSRTDRFVPNSPADAVGA